MIDLTARILAALLAFAPGVFLDDYDRPIVIAETIAAHSRNETEAAVLVAVGWMESGWRADVVSEARLGDGGAARGAYQLHNALGIAGDFDAQTEEAARRIRSSFAQCAASPYEDRLSVYASGRDCEAGAAASRARLAVARRVLAQMRAAH